MKIAGLDIGTTGCKITVFSQDGACLDKEYRDYPSSRGLSGHEIDAKGIMNAVWEVLSAVAGRHPDISGIGVTSFGETFVLTDAEGQPLLPSMLYTDPRGGRQLKELAEKLGEKRIAHITGLRLSEMYSIPKLMWIREKKPEIFEQAKYIFLIEDFVVFHLTGQRVIDYSLASRTMGLDIRKLEWSAEMFEAAGIDPDMMSKPVPTGTVAGNLKAEAAQKTGLGEDVKIVAISHDQVAAAVGAGVFDAGSAVDGAGTVECLTPVYDRMPDIDKMFEGYFSVVPYVIPGTYVAYAFSYTGGALIAWCCDQLAKKEKELAKEAGISVNEYLEKEYETLRGKEPSGMLVLPHFAGAATPYMDTGSEGAVIGLSVDTKVCELYRGCMEGVVYEMYLNHEMLADTGVSYTSLRATGGGARSKEWMQMKADVLNVPITALETVDAGTVGSAMLTGVAAGIFRDLAEAAQVMVQEREVYRPDPEMHEKYMKIYERYRKLYRAVRPLCRETSAE